MNEYLHINDLSDEDWCISCKTKIGPNFQIINWCSVGVAVILKPMQLKMYFVCPSREVVLLVIVRHVTYFHQSQTSYKLIIYPHLLCLYPQSCTRHLGAIYGKNENAQPGFHCLVLVEDRPLWNKLHRPMWKPSKWTWVKWWFSPGTRFLNWLGVTRPQYGRKQDYQISNSDYLGLWDTPVPLG